MRTSSKLGVAMAAFTVLALVNYFFIRIYYFLGPGHIPIDHFLAPILILAEGHSIAHALGFMLNIIRLQTGRYKVKTKKLGSNQPDVAILIPVRNEPRRVVEQTLIAFFGLEYPNKKIYLLDGSNKKEFILQNKALARRYGVGYRHSASSSHSKAQTINRFLPRVVEKYIAIFDADQNPLPNFLKETIGAIEVDEKIAFVQTPQLYSNIDVSSIARGAAMQQSVFYESICEAKSTVGAMFCCGTNVLIRTEALKRIGGFDEGSVTEDFSSSVDMHALGYESVYLNRVLVFGEAPESLPAYLKQQARWARGTTGVMRKLFFLFLKSPRSLTISQWWEYALSSTYYLSGWAFFVLMICPIVFLLFGFPSFFIRPEVYLASFIPYYVMSLTVYYGTMRKRHYAPSSVVEGIMMSSICFPVFMSASFNGLINRKTKFVVTPKGKGGRMGFWQLWPWHFMIILNIIAIYFAFSVKELNYAMAVNMLWCLYHIFILANIYRFNKNPKLLLKPVYAD